MNRNLGYNEANGLNNLGIVAGTGIWDASYTPSLAIHRGLYARDINDLGQIVSRDFSSAGVNKSEGDSVSGTEGGYGHEARFANNQGDHVGIYSLFIREWSFGEFMEEVGRPGEIQTRGKYHSYFGSPDRPLGSISVYHQHEVYSIVPPSEDYPLHRIDRHVESYVDVFQHFDPVGIDDDGFIPGLEQHNRDLPPIPRVFHKSDTSTSKAIPGAATVFSTSERGMVAGLTPGQEPALWQRGSDGTYVLTSTLPRPPGPGKLAFMKANDFNLVIGVTDTGERWRYLKRSWLWWKNQRNQWEITEVLPLAPEHWQGKNRELVLHDINQAGQFCGALATYGISLEDGRFIDQQDGQAVLISFPRARLAVDANRDRQIVFPGDPDGRPADQTKPGQPFRFWVNNDVDQETIIVQPTGVTVSPEDPSPPPGRLQDGQDDLILTLRDLEDFVPLAIDAAGLFPQLLAGSKHLALKWKNVIGKPGIRIFYAEEQNGTFTYMNDPTVAAAQKQHKGGAVVSLRGNAPLNANRTFVFKPETWDGATVDNAKKYFLFEAIGEGRGDLVLCLMDKKGTTVEREMAIVHLDLLNVKKMYERPTSNPARIPAPYNRRNGPVYPPVNVVDNPGNHPFSKPWDETSQNIVFVHGWSVDEDWYLMASETLFKRLWWQGYKGRLQAFRWRPYVVNEFALYAGQYNRSEHLAFYSGAALKVHLDRMQGRFQTTGLIAHSMGNIVASSALERGAKVDNYLLMEAAVPAGAYDTSGRISSVGGFTLYSGVNGYERFWRAESERRQTPDFHQGDLGYRGFFKNIRPNVRGQMVNFYNPLDYALATGRIFFGTKEANWEANQEEYKPDPVDGDPLSSGIVGYGYYPMNPPGQRGELRYMTGGREPALNRRWVTDPWEMMAFVARPRSKAVGAVGLDPALPSSSADNFPAGMVHVDLGDYDFDGRRDDHSGQFMRDIQEVWALHLLLNNLLIEPPSTP